MEPGSFAAKALGCICDQAANVNGSGSAPSDMYGRKFLVSESCIIHGMSTWNFPRVNDDRQWDVYDVQTNHSYTFRCNS